MPSRSIAPVPDENPYQSPAVIPVEPAPPRSPAANRRRKRILWGLILLLYVVTWVGGWYTHARDMKASAQVAYRLAQERNAEQQRQEPGRELPHYARLLEGGPKTGVNWAVPILPGVLLADSYQVIGPQYARGMVKIVLYYGVGTVVVCELWGWIA